MYFQLALAKSIILTSLWCAKPPKNKVSFKKNETGIIIGAKMYISSLTIAVHRY
jgi:hypothetical protein